VDISRTSVTPGGSIAGVGDDDKRRALEVSVDKLQQLGVRLSVFHGQVVEQQVPDTA